MRVINVTSGQPETFLLPYGPINPEPDPDQKAFWFQKPYLSPDEANFWYSILGDPTIAVVGDDWGRAPNLDRPKSGLGGLGADVFKFSPPSMPMASAGSSPTAASFDLTELHRLQAKRESGETLKSEEKERLAFLQKERTSEVVAKSKGWLKETPLWFQMTLVGLTVITIWKVANKFGGK